MAEQIVLNVMADGTIQGDGPGADDLVAVLNRYFQVMDITAPEVKAAEITRLAPTAQRVALQ